MKTLIKDALAFTILVLLVFSIIGIPAQNFFSNPIVSGEGQYEINEDLGKEFEKDLAEDYSPVFYFHRDEEYLPISANSLFERGTIVESIDLEITDPSNITDELIDYINDLGTYLVLKGDPVKIQEDYEPTVYYHVYESLSPSGKWYVVQYWMYYLYSDTAVGTSFIGDHQSDWENIQIVIDQNTSEPVYALYAFHGRGNIYEWDSLEREGRHPVVYVERGSHANYPSPNAAPLPYLVSGDVYMNDEDYELVDIEIWPWLNYKGRWDDSTSIVLPLHPDDFVDGPKQKWIWDHTIEWIDFITK